MSLKDSFYNLKTSIVGTKTVDIDTKLDKAVRDIVLYKSQSGRNGYIDLLRSVINQSNSGIDSNNFFSQGATTPEAFGHGNRIQRYKTYVAIVSTINYCARALDVLTDNILSPDDITKTSLEIKPLSILDDDATSESNEKIVRDLIKKTKLEEKLHIIIKNTLEYGDFFCEIADSKTALTSRAMISESYTAQRAYDFDSGNREIIRLENSNLPNIEMDYSSLVEVNKIKPINNTTGELNDKDTDDDSFDEMNLKNMDINILFHEPTRVVKLQSEMFPICFGYLVFPRMANFASGVNYQDQAVNTVCMSILRNLEGKIPGIKDLNSENKNELNSIITDLLKTTANIGNSIKIRYVSPEKMQHFMRPSTKYYPYGESVFDNMQYTAKVLIALETALAIQRISRSTEKRKIGVEIGLPRDARKMIEKMKEEFKKRKVSLDSFGTVDTIACFTLDTKIKLTNGKSLELGNIIEEFNKGTPMEVYSYDHKTGLIVPDKIVNAKITGRNVEVLKVTLDNGEYELCTPEHLWMMRDGSYKMAKDLEPNDSIMPLYTETSQIKTRSGHYEEMYVPGLDGWELTHKVFGKGLNLYTEENNTIHHIDKNPRNNSSDNLYVCSQSEHAHIHSTDDGENPYNGSNRGINKLYKENECIICKNTFEKPYWHDYKVCSVECLNEYKKTYSYNSWVNRKDKNEYELVNTNCMNCGKEVQITKSLLYYKNKMNAKISCGGSECKSFVDSYSKLSKYVSELSYDNCISCGSLFVYKSDSKRKVCSRKCALKMDHVDKNAKKISLPSVCDHCGKETYKKLNTGKFKSCTDPICISSIAKLNLTYTKRNGKLYDDVSFVECATCGKLTSINKNKRGYVYNTCGSRKCGGTAMHRMFKPADDIERVKRNLASSSVLVNHKIVSVEKVEGLRDVGDIQTEKYHNFGLTGGAFVHNSSITTFEDLYLPMKDGKPFVDIDTFTAGNVDIRSKVDELKFLRDQLIASLGIPPSFIGIEENLSAKATLTEENILFARTIIAHQKYFTHHINDLLEKIITIINPEAALTLLDDVSVALPTPTGLQYERESKYMNDIVQLISSLEQIGIPKEYSKRKYLRGMDWDEIKKYELEENIDKKMGLEQDDNGMGGGGGFDAGGMGGAGGLGY